MYKIIIKITIERENIINYKPFKKMKKSVLNETFLKRYSINHLRLEYYLNKPKYQVLLLYY